MQRKIISAATHPYPVSGGKPMAETDWHRKLLMNLLQMIEHHFREHDCDPRHQIQPHFIGFRLVDGAYEEMAFVNERFPSSVLNFRTR